MPRKKTEKQIQTTVARVRRMEPLLEECTAEVERFRESLERFAAVQKKIKALSDYYGSAGWRGDLEAYEQQALPADLKCGVLSEDLIYDVITDNREAALDMLDLAADMLRRI